MDIKLKRLLEHLNVKCKYFHVNRECVRCSAGFHYANCDGNILKCDLTDEECG